MFSARAGLKPLARLSRRLSTSLEAGIDIRRTFQREFENVKGTLRPRLQRLSEGANRGESLQESFNATGDYFPTLFRQLVGVGEKTGHTAEVFGQLAAHYENQLVLRQAFLRSITVPILQLSAALCVVGLLIWIMGFLQSSGMKIDLLGWGLIGTPGLLIYLFIVGSIATAIALLVYTAQRGALWLAPVQQIMLKVPQLGPALRTIAEARFAWTLHIAMNTGMDVLHALRLALDSTGNAVFQRQTDGVLGVIRNGGSIHDALSQTGQFSHELLDTVAVGEESGRLVESLGLAARQMQERARSALAILTTIAGYLIWALVSMFIIMLIFKIFGFYVGTINDLAKP